jgi:hypothetical protein
VRLVVRDRGVNAKSQRDETLNERGVKSILAC